MISFLQGIILDKNEKTLTLLTSGGVGYSISIAKIYLEKQNIGSELSLFIHTHVREDEISLYGFANIEELNFFKQLLSVNGIGPKIALEILGNPIEVIQRAIIQEDRFTLTKTPGLGRKIADRIILELKNKITMSLESSKSLDGKYQTQEANIHEDVITALVNLGYQYQHIKRVLKNIDSTVTEPEEIVKYFLRHA